MQTYTQTHTSTYARHIASKVAADLKRLQRLYGVNSPSDKEIDEYQAEISMLLDAEYLGKVTYGFKRGDSWVVAFKYHAVGNQVGRVDGDPGGIWPTENIDGAYFTSFLTYSAAWSVLSKEQRDAFKATLPFQRVSGNEPGIENGRWVGGRNYVSGTLGVQRSMIEKYR